jgi:NAD(P)-dependent dehydrogenase (short-subunit alcohol dehydrogenase family)
LTDVLRIDIFYIKEEGLMDLGLVGKVVLVTGAGSGVGAEIARAFCNEQATTIFSDIDSYGLKRAVEGYERYGIYRECDVTIKDQVKKLFDEIEKTFSVLHILINNAAVNSAQYIENISEEELERVINVNIKGYINTTVKALPLMKKAGYGRLIYINSGSGLKASAGLPVYSASKYFNRGFAISAALEAGIYNITSNSICPSDIYPEGDLGAKSWTTDSLVKITLEKEGVSSLEELIKKRSRANPMNRSCRKEDVAHLALFLASDKAGFINGQSIGLNGGALPY